MAHSYGAGESALFRPTWQSSFTGIKIRGTDPAVPTWDTVDFYKTVFIGLDFTGITLRRVRLQGCKFEHCKFGEIKFADEDVLASRTEFEGCDLSGAVFEVKKLDHLNFIDCKLTGVDLENAKLNSCKLNACDLGNSNLKRVTGDLSLVNVNLTEADMRCCRLEGSNWEGVVANRIKLEGGVLVGVSMWGTSFQNSDLRAADLGQSIFQDCCFKGARMRNMSAMFSKFYDCDMSNAHLDAVDFTGVEFTRGSLKGVESNNGMFSLDRFREVDMRKLAFDATAVNGSAFIDCDLRDSKIVNGAFDDTKIQDCRTQRMSWTSAHGDIIEQTKTKN